MRRLLCECLRKPALTGLAGRKGRWTAVALAAGSLLVLSEAGAQAPAVWPQRPVRVIAPFVAGGTTDGLGRVVAQKLADEFHQSFVVENRGGAGGLIGAELVARAAPDGYTLLISGIAPLILAPAMTQASFDGLRDFTHVALLGGPPDVLVVPTASEARDLRSFIALTRTALLSYGSAGSGTQGQLVGELFRRAAGINLAHVPYKGAGPAVADVIAGHLPSAVVTVTAALGNLNAGKLRALAVSSRVRMADFPDVPTFAELGFGDVVGVVWFSISGPAGMAPEIVQRLNGAVRNALHQPDVRERLRRESIEPNDMTPSQFTEFVRAEQARWTPVMRTVVAAGN
jgi:tripartite-type tricarboxylate transporter receptor subunit TctC